MAKWELSYNPLYLQVKDIIKKKVVDGVYKPGATIPSEANLASELKVSVATVRQALSILVSEGILKKIQGKGTFVNEKKIEISFFTWVGHTLRGESIINNLIDLFEKKYKSIRIRVIPTLHKNALKELMKLISQGKAPDVVQIASFWTSYLNSFGALEPLDELLPQDNLKNRFYEKDLIGGLIGDKLYAVSWGLCPRSLIANKKVLRDAGIQNIPSPLTLETFVEICKKIDIVYKDKNVYSFGISQMDDETDFLGVHSFLQAFGGGFLVNNSKKFIYTDENIRAFNWLKKFMTECKIYRGDINDLRKEFAEGKIAFFLDGPFIKYLLEELTGRDFDQDFSVLLHPVHYDSNSYTYNYSHALAICSQSRNKEAAAKFIDAVTNDREISKFYYKATGELPTNKNHLNDPEFDSEYFRAFKKQLTHSIMINSQHALFEKAMVFCKESVHKIFYKGVDIEKELSEKEHYLEMLYYG